MKRIFNRTSQAITPFQDEPQDYRSSNDGQYSNSDDKNSYNRASHDDQARVNPPGRQREAIPRSRPPGQFESPLPERHSKHPQPGGAYPSYGEVHQNPNEGRANLSAGRGSQAIQLSDQVSHKKLPARTTPNRIPPDNNHRQTRSSTQNQYNWEAGQVEDQHVRRYNRRSDMPDPLPNPHGSGSNAGGYDAGLGRKGSTSRSHGATMSRIRSISKRGSQIPTGNYGDEGAPQPTRRPSLLYDSGLHGGQAAVAAANANEYQVHENAARQNQERDTNVVRPESRYVDRYVEVKTPQSAAIGAGVDKMRRKLFGKKKKDELANEEEKESSGEWARIEHPGSVDQKYMQRSDTPEELEDRRRGEHAPTHTPWFSGIKNNKSSEGIITSQIGFFCIKDEEEWDWNQMSALCNMISHSELASKEAARALRKEFKYGEEEPKFRAVRLWAIICVKSSDRFRLQVANKKFLEVLEDLYTTDKRTNTKIRGRLLVAWSMLAYEYQLDQELYPISKLFNKIKPNDMPVNGVPLDLSHDLFNPAGLVEQQGQNRNIIPPGQDIYHDLHTEPQPILEQQRQHQLQYQQQIQQHREHLPKTQTTVTRTTSVTYATPTHHTEESIPRISEDIRRLHEECQVARNNAQVMTDSLIEHGLQDELVIEFARKTQMSQDFILAQIPWASAQVDRSRLERQERIASSIPDIDDGQRSNDEEMLMKDLLDTHEKLTAANGLVEEARNREREEEEERQVIDRSMREQRIDRSQLMQDTKTGQLYSLDNQLAPVSSEGGGGGQASSSSRAPSPIPPIGRRPLPVPGGGADAGTPMEKSLSTPSRFPVPASTLLAPAPPSLDSSWLDQPHHPLVGNDGLKAANSTSTYRGGPRPMNGSEVSQHIPVDGGTTANSNSNSNGKLNTAAYSSHNSEDEEVDEDGDSIIMTPIAPSAKALGKRRALSVYEGVPSPSDKTVANGTELATNIDALQLHSDTNEDALRARPPPALPIEPITTTATMEQRPLVTTNPYYQYTTSDPYNDNQHNTNHLAKTNPFRT